MPKYINRITEQRGGESCLAGAPDIVLLVCEMIAGRMNAKLTRDMEFKDGLHFVIELPL
ncbi:hypothetical protein [Phocaeicola vulgatus]|uniref:hypothetical protein n=1 Tax=Phocaeicola vulgatus TaxID=821 RepID=UPI0015F2F9D5|nr:hypothetical protein [Phocaeicola vulgatus]MCG0293372.1 hypothetical protein [Phocaeicola vulgatus]